MYVSEMCLKSYPCQHTVTLEDGRDYLLSGVDIAKLYMHRNIPVPEHFEEYKPSAYIIHLEKLSSFITYMFMTSWSAVRTVFEYLRRGLVFIGYS